MVDFRIGGLLCSLAFIPSLAHADVVQFPGAGTVKLSNGYTGRIVGATALNPSTKTMSAVIDARDKFGNNIRVTRTLKAIPARLAAFGRTCLSPQGALVCAAAAAITTYAAYEGYQIVNGWLVQPGITPGKCPSNTMAIPYAPPPPPGVPVEDWNPDVTYIQTWVAMPCVDDKYSSRQIAYSHVDTPELRAWATHVDNPTSRWYMTWDQWDEYNAGTNSGGIHPNISQLMQSGNTWKYTRYISSSTPAEPVPIGDTQLSESDFADLVFKDPSMLQIESGLYPDVWETVNVDGEVGNPGDGTNPNPDPEPKPEDMIDVSEVPEETVDLSSYFDWGSGWLPKTCPAPVSFPIMGDSFDFKYDTLCSSISTYVAPMIRFVAIMVFLNILIGGGARE